MASGMISIVLRAVDDYSKTLTGLNAATALVGKGFGLLKGAADVTFNAIDKGIKLASDAGQYVEMRRQFNNVAVAYGRDGQSIIDTIDKISQNTVGLADAARIAGKGVAAGLSEKQIATALEFVKKRTELTGESFTGMAETVFRAISGGRTGTLAQLGLVVKDGANVADIMREMEFRTKAFGDTGFNAKDKIDALRQQLSRFFSIIGVAINEMPLFQRIMTWITDSFIRFIKWLDPRPITVFFESFGQLIVRMMRAAATAFPAIGNMLSTLFYGSDVPMTYFATAFGEKMFDVVRSVGTAVNNIIDIVAGSEIVEKVAVIMESVGFLVFENLAAVTSGIGKLIAFVIRGQSEVYGLMGDMARDYPLLADKLGIDPLKMADTERAMKHTARIIQDSTETMASGFDWVSKAAPKAIRDAAAALASQRIDMGFIDKMQDEWRKGMLKIDVSKSWGEDLGTTIAAGAEGAFKDVMGTLDMKAFERAEKAAEKAQNDREKAIEKAVKAEEQANKRKEAALEKTIKVTENAAAKELQRAEKVESANRSLVESATQDMSILREATRAVGDVTKLSGYEFAMFTERLKRLQEIEAKSTFGPYARLVESLKQVNWPSEFAALGEFIFKWALTVAAGEAVPLNISTAGV